MIDSIKGLSSMLSTSSPTGVDTEATNPISGSAALGATQGASGQSFADVMSSLTTDAVDQLKLSETKSFEAISGKATTREVVDAVMNAEQSLQTAIAIRDKVVTAYLEIARMQI